MLSKQTETQGSSGHEASDEDNHEENQTRISDQKEDERRQKTSANHQQTFIEAGENHAETIHETGENHFQTIQKPVLYHGQANHAAGASQKESKPVTIHGETIW